MAKSEVKFGKTVSLTEAEELLINVRRNRFHLRDARLSAYWPHARSMRPPRLARWG